MKISDLIPLVLIFVEVFEGIYGEVVELLSWANIELLNELEAEKNTFEPIFRLNEELALEVVFFEHELVNFVRKIVRDTIFSNLEKMSCVVCSVMSARDDSNVCSSYCQYELELNPISTPEIQVEEIKTDVDTLKWVKDELNRVKFDISRIRRAKKLTNEEKKEKLLELAKLQVELKLKLESY